MNKRIITSLLLVFCMVFVAVFAVSCDEATENSVNSDAGDNSADVSLPVQNESSAPADDGKVTYTVTVVDEENNPIEGIIIQFCDDANCKMPVVTDADGKVTVEYNESNYHITITEANGYTFEEQYDFEEDSTSLTITLKAE